MKLKKYKSQKSDDLHSKLKSYSALTGAFLLTAGTAQSQIIYTDVNPDAAISKSAYDIDMDHDGTIDFQFIHWTTYGVDKGVELRAGANVQNKAMGILAQFNFFPFYYVLNLPAGNPIGPGGPFYSFAQQLSTSLRICRQWQQFHYDSQGNVSISTYKNGFFINDSGYVGVQFNSNGNIFYGWIECEIDSAADTLLVKSYAYEATPDMHILAGAGRTDGIEEQQSLIKPSSSFYPNPVTNRRTSIRIEAKQNTELKLEVLNGMCQVLQSETRSLNAGNNLVELNLTSLAAGNYFVKLTEGDKTFFRKILISN